MNSVLFDSAVSDDESRELLHIPEQICLDYEPGTALVGAAGKVEASVGAA